MEQSRNGFHVSWARKPLSQAKRNIRQMQQHYCIDRINRLEQKKTINIRRLSCNKINEKKKRRVKFGIKIPNSVREALILDSENKNSLWADAIKKEMAALGKAGVFQYISPNYCIPNGYQYAPLRIIFEVKQEDLRRKAQMVAGGHVVDSTMYESYSSVVQTMTFILLQTVAANQNLKVVTGRL